MANGASPPRAPPRHCVGQGRLIVRQRDEALLNFKTLLKEKVGSVAPRVRSAVRAYGHRSAAQQQAERPSSIARSAAAELSETGGGGGPRGVHAATSAQDSLARLWRRRCRAAPSSGRTCGTGAHSKVLRIAPWPCGCRPHGAWCVLQFRVSLRGAVCCMLRAMAWQRAEGPEGQVGVLVGREGARGESDSPAPLFALQAPLFALSAPLFA
jgi:hypothetical protein